LSVKWLKRLAILLIILLVLIGLPFLIPLSTYIPQIEKLAGEKLHEPVKIGSLHVSLVPLPHVALRDITVGVKQEIRIHSIAVFPELNSLFDEVRVLRKIELDTVAIQQDILARAPLWVKSDGGPAVVKIEKVALKHVTLESPAMKLGPLSVVVNLAESGGLAVALISSDDGKLKLAVQPEQDNFRLDLSASKWQPPAGPALVFDELRIQGVASAVDLKLKQINAKLYGGSIQGATVLSWKDAWRLDGKLQAQQIDLQRLVPVFSKDVSVSGRLNATASYGMAAKGAGQLFDAPRATVPFNVQNGVLHNVDLAAAARTFSKEGMRGGKTEFDELESTLEVAGRAYQFNRIKVASGVLAANGDVAISPKKELGGNVKVEMKGTAGMVAVPLEVSGTTKNPVLKPTSGYLAGAATGTMLLGPGLGTSLGAKAGETMQKLFN
jgi:uncharacterized protein involved in outer membrane biogenesis